MIVWGQPIPKVVQGHNFQLNSVAISENGKRVVSAAGDKKMIFWDADLKKELAVISEGSSGFSGVSISPSGDFFSAMYQGQFWVWDSETMNPIFKLKPEDRFKGMGMASVIMNEEEACVVIDDKLKKVNFKTKTVIEETEILEKTPAKIWYDKSRNIISTFGFTDQKLRIYDGSKLALTNEIECGMQEVLSLSYHPKIDKILIAGNAAKAKEIDFQGKLISEFGHEEAINLPLCFYYDESVYGVSYNKLFKWQDGKSEFTQHEFESIIATRPNSKGQIPIGNWDFSVGVLDFEKKPEYSNFEVEMVHCEGLMATENGIIFKGRDGIIREIEFSNILDPKISDFNRNDSYENVQTQGNLQTFSLTDDFIFSSNEKEVYIKSRKSNETLEKIETSDHILSTVSSGNVIYDVSSNYNGSQISKTDLITKNRTPFLFLKDVAITQLKLSKENQLLAASSGSAFKEGAVYVINKTAEIIDSIPIGKRPITDVKYYSKENKLFYATGGFLQNVVGLDLESKEEIYRSKGRVVAYSPGENVVAFYKNQTGEKTAEITINTLEGESISTFEAHESIISHMVFSKNGKYLISCSWDKSLKIWDWKNSKLLLSVYFNAESDNYHLLTPNSYYFTSKENVDDIFFVEDGSIGLFEQFDVHLNRPDKVLESFEDSDDELIKFYKKAHQKRLERLGTIEKSPTELGSLEEAPQVNYEYDQTATVLFTGDFRNIKVKQNGVVLNSSQLKTDKKKTKCSIVLLSGKNHFEFYSISTSGTKSHSRYAIINNPTKTESNLYLITLAASEFEDESFNLNYASKDAKDIQTHFKSSWNSGKVHSFQLLNKDFNSGAIEDISEFLEDSDNNDVVMVFISSHGVLDANYDYYLASHDMNFQKPSENGISLKSIESLVSQSSSLQKVIFVDACHSGEIDKTEIVKTESTSEEIDDVSFRGFQKFKSTADLSAFQVSKELFTDLSSESGISFISSAAGVEFALEGDEWKNGIFTYVLLQALKNVTADLNADGKISLSEMEKHLIYKVPALTGGAQQPNARIKNPHLDFIIQEKK
jgi:WD40 repeat protein